MEFRHLRAFVAVAHELNFRRASEHLYLAQPAVSQQVRALESEIGIELFDRTTRHVRLTAAGVSLLPTARQILEQADQFLHEANELGQSEDTRFVIGCSAGIGTQRVTLVLNTLSKQLRGLHPAVRVMFTPEQVESLKTGIIQAGIVRYPEPDDAVETRSIWVSRHFVALPENSALANLPSVPLRDLIDQPLITMNREVNPRLFDHLMSQVRTLGGAKPALAYYESSEVKVTLDLVASGEGWGIVETSLAASTERRGVVFRPIEEPGITSEVSVAWRRGDQSIAVRGFLDVIEALRREGAFENESILGSPAA